jgi:hypothetical protein
MSERLKPLDSQGVSEVEKDVFVRSLISVIVRVFCILIEPVIARINLNDCSVQDIRRLNCYK